MNFFQGVRCVNLILRDSKHDENRIKKGWLNLSENIHPQIHSLTLDNKLLEEIGDYSFDAMQQMNEIVIINTNLKILTRNAFKVQPKSLITHMLILNFALHFRICTKFGVLV